MRRGAFALLLIAAAPACGQAAGAPVSFERRSPSGLTDIQFWSDRIVRVVHRPAGTPIPDRSFSVVAAPEPVRVRARETPASLTLETGALRVSVAGPAGAVAIFTAEGRLLLGEAPPGTANESPAPGLAARAVRQSFGLSPGEAIFGLGQQPDGALNRVGRLVHLQQQNGRVAIPVLLSSLGYALLWDNPSITDVDAGASARDRLTWTSEAGRAVDYYFCSGPDPNGAIASYRKLTGEAPLFGQWAWGFWQCRERYQTQEQLLGVVAEYRRLGVPLDGIIQDWQYWVPGTWGSHRFDPKRYPDPAAMVEAVHRAHAHIIISVWPKFDLGLAHTAELEKAGALFDPVFPSVYPKGSNRWYDAFSARGRAIYWRQVSQSLFRLGFDGWWLDASEPELAGHWGELRGLRTAAGPGSAVFNAYPLLHTSAVYQGQRAESRSQRVFLLTRSAYAGQQRNAAVTWSGDIHGTWQVLRQQIPAGLNFVASGIPYWNTDIGGFIGKDPADPAYAELFTRWFQFGAFCPMFRVHGTGKPKEIWRFDPATEAILADFIRLRYRLLPYIYSTSWQVTRNGASLMRPLAMDFPEDAKTHDITDQYLFGPGLMVCPVTRPGAASRGVYLPADPSGAPWTDFWTGRTHPAGTTVEAAAPITRLPLFVRAGSILPWGPAVQYAGEKPAAPLTLRIYRGADGRFVLYEDAGEGYAYDRGAFSTIPIAWNERAGTLTIGRREGGFPGMAGRRDFRVVWVSAGHGAGPESADVIDAEVAYEGDPLVLRAPVR